MDQISPASLERLMADRMRHYDQYLRSSPKCGGYDSWLGGQLFLLAHLLGLTNGQVSQMLNVVYHYTWFFLASARDQNIDEHHFLQPFYESLQQWWDDSCLTLASVQLPPLDPSTVREEYRHLLHEHVSLDWIDEM